MLIYFTFQAMKTYHQYQIESKTAEEALKKVQSQKAKIEQQLSGKSLSGSRKFKKIEKQEEEVTAVLPVFIVEKWLFLARNDSVYEIRCSLNIPL